MVTDDGLQLSRLRLRTVWKLPRGLKESTEENTEVSHSSPHEVSVNPDQHKSRH